MPLIYTKCKQRGEIGNYRYFEFIFFFELMEEKRFLNFLILGEK